MKKLRAVAALFIAFALGFGAVRFAPDARAFLKAVSVQSPGAVAITGGTINGASVGATTAGTGAFTTLSASGAISPSTTQGIVGTVAADSAQSGSVGEYLEAQCARATSGAVLSFTLASPTVGTWASPPWVGTGAATIACPFQITANAPTGLSTSTNYWAVPASASTFKVATSAANAMAGTFANTTGSSSTANLTTGALLSTTAGLAGAGMSITAGDWDCSASTLYVPASSTSVTNLSQGVSTSSTALGNLGTYSDLEFAASVLTATNSPVQPTPTARVNVSSTTSYFVTNIATFTLSTLAATSDLRCRRVR
jgi:hypothetical protein